MFKNRGFLIDPEWQELKGRLSNSWKNNPVGNVLILRSYLGDFTSVTKIRRVANYLTGAGFQALRQGQIELCDLLREIEQKRMELNV